MPGYEVDPLKPPPAELMCSECLLLLREAVQTEGGHRLCRTCYEEIKRTGVSKSGIKLDGEKCYPDNAINREVAELQVNCTYYQNGCTWKGKLQDIEVHIQHHCQHQPLQCGCEALPAVTLNEDNCPSVTCSFDEQVSQSASRDSSSSSDLEEPIPLPHHHTTCQQSTAEPFGRTVDHLMRRTQIATKVAEETNGLLDDQVSQQTMNGSMMDSTIHQIEGLFLKSKVVQLQKRVEDLEWENAHLKALLFRQQRQELSSSTHNGSFLWRISEVSDRRRSALENQITSINSSPFYSGRYGYKMCIRAYLNGDGTGYQTHLSLFFVLMKGEYDPLLKWPFDSKVSLTLFDQNHRKHIVQTFKPTPDNISFKRPTSNMNVASGCPQFAKLSVLEDPSYVKDDIMFVKCVVDTSRVFHP